MSSSDITLFEEIFLMSKKEIDNKFKYLGEGGGRIVYDINNDYVLKLSKFRGGYKQCETENYIYHNVQQHLKKYLCPVVWYKEDMIIMRKAIPLAKERKEKHKNVFRRLGISEEDTLYINIEELVKTFNLLYGDIKSLSSWGILDNQIILIDYGCTNKIFRKYFA